MSSSQGSFSIKSSHKFINPVVKEEEDIEKETNFYISWTAISRFAVNNITQVHW